MFLKLVEELNEEFYEKNGEADSIPLTYMTDGCSSAIYYRNEVLFCEDDWCWDGEEEGDLRFGKGEYECLKEDVLEELSKIYLSLDSLIAVFKDLNCGKEIPA